MRPPPTGILTFLFTDIEGSTQLWEQRPAAMRLALARHDNCLRDVIESHRGRIFKRIGDAFCATFEQATDAIAAAITAQQSLRALECNGITSGADPGDAAAPLEDAPLGSDEYPRDMPLRVRIALHTGAAETREGDYFGPSLNRIARMLAAGYGGQVLLSRTTYELVRSELPPGVSLRDLGLHRLRDLNLPERIYQLLHPDLPADFPLLKSLRFLSHNLPQQTTHFIGRERELAEIKRMLAAGAVASPADGYPLSAVGDDGPATMDGRQPGVDSPRLLTLTGTGGTGKTRLALQMAAELVTRYEDGIWLVELSALTDPALVPHAVAAALSVSEEPGKNLTQTLAELLQPQHLLLIMDNCEHLLTGCAELAHALLRRCPNLQILATSRERLNIQGEQTYRVPSLAAPDPRALPPTLGGQALVAAVAPFEAVQMFLSRAVLASSSFALTAENARLVAQICHRLDGIPLAIELAAARLNVLSVEQIAELEDRFRWLTGGSRVAPPRQQTLRALVDWSYDLLSAQEKALLRRLSVFAGGFTADAAEAVGLGDGAEPGGALDLLGSLVDKSLVLADEAPLSASGSRVPAKRVAGEGLRYRLLDTIRQYASEKLWQAGEGAAARWRYRNSCLEFAEDALQALSGPLREICLRQLVREYDNLRTALRPAPGQKEERTDWPLGEELLERWGQAVEGLATAYRQLSRTEPALGILEDYVRLCQTETSALSLARAYTRMALFRRLNPPAGGSETSRSYYERAIAICEARGLKDWAVYPRARLAHDLAMDGVELDLAEALARACPPDAAAGRDIQWLPSGQRTLAPTIYSALMWVAIHRSDWEALRAAFEQSLKWGGPARSPLLEMLTRIEEACGGRGEEEAFRDLCRFMAAEYARAGLAAPLQQWFLEPAPPRSLPGEPLLREEFDGDEWHPLLRWHDVTGRSRVDRTTRPGWIGLYPAEGCDLWPPKDLNAPRLLAAVRGDFLAQTRVELGSGTGALAGLLVWQDERHFARLELQARRAGWDRVEAVLEACVDGEFWQIGRGQCARQPGTHAVGGWLRLERRGHELRALCSEDDEQWLACGRVDLPPGGADEVGLAAIPHSPGGYAWFDCFLLWQKNTG
jgi:predicted ATPase/class 3 adenylate cyclase